MRYTQLYFVPYWLGGGTLFSQAKWLLHELLEDRHHSFPCDCGTCIYAAYRKRKKNEGRSFSKRTFFVFFLWMDYFTSTFYDRRLSSRGSLKPLKGQPGIFYWQSSAGKIAERKRVDILEEEHLESFKDIWKLGKRRRLKIIKKLDRAHSTDIFWEKVKKITKKRTRWMIKKLYEKEKSQQGKTFLRSILQKRCFYTYYARAANQKLYETAFEIRRDLSKAPPKIVQNH